MAGLTNRGKLIMLNCTMRGQQVPNAFKICLITGVVGGISLWDMKVFADVVEIATGYGYEYTSGMNLSRNTTDFDVAGVDEASDFGYVQLKDIVWTAAGGTIPKSGGGAKYAVLMDNTSSGNVYGYWDLSGEKSLQDGQCLTLQNFELRINES